MVNVTSDMFAQGHAIATESLKGKADMLRSVHYKGLKAPVFLANSMPGHRSTDA